MAVNNCIVGERIKQARMSKKMTQEKLAEKLGVSVTYLSRIERGSILVNLKRLSQICENLEVSEGEILNGTSKSTKNYMNDEISNLLKNCPPDKIELIYNIAKVIVNGK